MPTRCRLARMPVTKWDFEHLLKLIEKIEKKEPLSRNLQDGLGVLKNIKNLGWPKDPDEKVDVTPAFVQTRNPEQASTPSTAKKCAVGARGLLNLASERAEYDYDRTAYIRQEGEQFFLEWGVE